MAGINSLDDLKAGDAGLNVRPLEDQTAEAARAAAAGDDLSDVTKNLNDQPISGRQYDSLKEPTVWADFVYETVRPVIRKQFHTDTEPWKAFTKHVIYHEPRNSALTGAIGGLNFQVPFDVTGRSIRTLSSLTERTQGWWTRFTSGGTDLRHGLHLPAGRRGYMAIIGEGGPLKKMRAWWWKTGSTGRPPLRPGHHP